MHEQGEGPRLPKTLKLRYLLREDAGYTGLILNAHACVNVIPRDKQQKLAPITPQSVVSKITLP